MDSLKKFEKITPRIRFFSFSKFYIYFPSNRKFNVFLSYNPKDNLFRACFPTMQRKMQELFIWYVVYIKHTSTGLNSFLPKSLPSVKIYHVS